MCSLSSLALVLKVSHPLCFDTSVVLYIHVAFCERYGAHTTAACLANSVFLMPGSIPRGLCANSHPKDMAERILFRG